MVTDAESVCGSNVGTDAPGDDVMVAQQQFILTRLVQQNIIEKVGTVEYGEGLRLWRLLVTDFKPKFASRKMVLQKGNLNFSFGASEDPRKGIDRLETEVRQRGKLTMTRGQEFLSCERQRMQKKLSYQLGLNACRVESVSEMKREIRDYLEKQWLTSGAAEVMVIGDGDGKTKKGKHQR